MHPPVKCFRGLGIDVSLPDEAAEGGLNVGARAAEAIVQVEMTKGGVEVVTPEEADNPTSEPDTFRVSSRAGQKPSRLGDFVDFFLTFLGGVSCGLLRFGRLAVTATLREGSRVIETKGRHAAKHGKNLTQPDSETHCPRRMFDLVRTPVLRPCVGPDWDANTAVIYLVNPPP
jgi:hypothetical protein